MLLKGENTLSAVVRYLLVGIMILSLDNLNAQIFTMQNGDVQTCTGVFQDDGGTNEYGTNQTLTFTICPDNPGDVISVEFVAFALFQSPNPNNSDFLSIFDGDNAGAATLGDYTGNSLQGVPVTGTVMNATGCMTFVFSSGPNSTAGAGWEALISCTTPCANPTAASVITDPAPEGAFQSVGVCLGQEITFSDNGSFPASGFNLELWEWNFGDGSIDTIPSSSDITHAFDEPGEYLVGLSVIDDNGCRSLNLDPLQILVSTIPLFNTEFETPICIDNPANINGNPVQSITWTALPPQTVAGQTYLADGAGFSYSTSLVFDFFEPGAVLESCDDFLNVFVNMEHSFLGDLGFFLTCPDGTTVNMLTFDVNSGGGTFLGEPVDDFQGSPDGLDQGVGYDYGWSPSSTNGFIWDPDNSTEIDFITTSGEETSGNIVNPGLYESEEDLCNFVGCPLNGEWTFSVSDNLGADDGYIFEWGIEWNPSLFPDVTTFTPVVGLESDSSFWQGPNIINTSDNGNSIDIIHDTPGFYEYTFFATNNFACTFDTTIVIEAVEGPEITAGPDLNVCEDPVTLQAGVVGATGVCSQDAGTYTYCYEDNQDILVTYCPDNMGDGITFMELTFVSGTNENGIDDIFVYDGPDDSFPLIASPVLDGNPGQSFVATNPTGCISFEITPDGSIDCAGGFEEPIVVSVGCSGASGLVWEWTPVDGLSNPNVPNPEVFVTQPTVYTVSAFPEGLPGCVITDQVLVAPDQDVNPGVDNDTTLCYNNTTSLLLSYLDGSPAGGGTWTDNNTGAPFGADQITPTDFPNGATFDLTYTVTNGLCENSSNLQITILPVTDNSCCQTNANPGPDAVACALTYQLQGDIPVGIGTWSGDPELIFSDVNDPQATVTAPSPGGTYTLTWTDFNGQLCSNSNTVEIVLADSLELVVVPEDAICFNECSGTAVAIPSGGTSSNGLYSIEWSGGVSGGVAILQDSLCFGTWKATVTDNVGCVDSTFFEIGQPEPMELTALGSPALCRDSCNARVVLNSPDAVEYSYNGGMTWVLDNVGFICPDSLTDVGIRNELGCELFDSLFLDNPVAFTADFNVNPSPTTIQNPLVTFQDISVPGPIARTRFLIGDPVFAEENSRISSYRFPTDTAGEYLITLISESENGCIDTTSNILTINDDLLWFIPNSFSPNGDGINDIWKPIGSTVDLSSYSCKLYDRWGRQVFHTTNIEQGWNGDSAQNDEFFADSDVYTYVLEITSATTEEKFEITGFLTLIR